MNKQNEHCHVESCTSALTVIKAISFYDLVKHQSDANDLVIEFCQENDVLNSYHHILEHHNQNEYKIHDKLTKLLKIKCTIQNCPVFVRHQNEDHVENGNFYLQLIDDMHCNFIHSFDIGYRIQQKTITDIDNDDTNSVEYIDKGILQLKRDILQKRSQHNVTRDTLRLSQRFTLSLSDIKPFSNRNCVTNYYEIGHRWLYGTGKVQHTNDTKSKYNNIKEEIINNKRNAISMYAYNTYYHKADTYLNHSNRIKSMKSKNGILCKHHGIKHNESISIHHILSIILWCDSRSLNTGLRETYINNNNLREYWHWSTHLIQSVECFGDSLNLNQRFYHHLTTTDSTELNDYYFTDFSVKYCAPTSTTSQLPVAIISSIDNDDGIILQLQRHNTDIYAELNYIDCRFFSAHSNEDEKLFFGGLYPLKIRNITINENGRSFKPLIDALALFDHAIKGERYINPNKDVIDMKCLAMIINDLINKVKSVPIYALHIFDCFCDTKKEIIIDLKWLRTDYPLLKEYFISNTNVMRFSKLCSIFRYCTRIKIVNALRISSLYLSQQLFEFETEDEHFLNLSSLQEISFINIKLGAMCNKKVLEQHKLQFRNRHFELTFSLNDDDHCDMLLNKQSLEQTQEYKDIKRTIQDRLSLLLTWRSDHDTDKTGKEYHAHQKQRFKTSNDLWNDVSVCLCKDTKLDIYTHCESVQRLCVVLDAYKKVMGSTSLCRNVSLAPILVFNDIYTLNEINNDFDHVKSHIDDTNSGNDSENKLHRRFIKEFECKLSLCRRIGRRGRPKYSYPTMHIEDTVFQGNIDSIHHFMVHYNDEYVYDEDEKVLSSSSINEPPSSGKTYIGKKEDDMWWQYNEPTESKHDIEHDADRPIYRQLVEKMGIFRWQCAHGFTTEQHQGLMHLKPKWSNIKEEALQNNYYALSTDNWNQTLRKSDVFYASFARRRIITRYIGTFDDKISGQFVRWGIGQNIDRSEVVTLKLYTDFDKLQYELKKCFRFDILSDIFALQNFDTNTTSSLDDTNTKTKRFKLEDRLSEFYWWRLKLLVVLNKFGEKMTDKIPLYHGVNAKMLVNNGMRAGLDFYGPLSTSAAYHVARTFATAKGMVLQVTTQYPRLGICRAFNASLISDYPEEKEWLIGFVYLRILKVITRPLSKGWTTFKDVDDFNAEPHRRIPLSSKTRSIFFAVHLFRQQMFSMSVHSEYWLTAFLYLNCDYDQDKDNKDNKRIRRTHFVKELEKVKKIKMNKDNKSNDDDRYHRILRILCNKFENFRKFPNKKQVLKIDKISANLKPYFMDYDGADLHKQERYTISFTKIMRIFPNIKEIHFINSYPLNNDVLQKLIEFLYSNKCNKLRKIKLMYYDNETQREPHDTNKFFDPKGLNNELLNTLKKQNKWEMKFKYIGETGFQIQLYSSL